MKNINVSPPSVNDTVIGDVNVNIGVPGLSNGNVPGHAFTLIFFNDGEHQTSQVELAVCKILPKIYILQLEANHKLIPLAKQMTNMKVQLNVHYTT